MSTPIRSVDGNPERPGDDWTGGCVVDAHASDDRIIGSHDRRNVDSKANVSDRRRTSSGRLGRLVAGSSLTLVLAVAAVACGSDADQAGSGASPDSAAPAADAAAYGEQLSRSSGCAGCHGANFGGGAGPDWIGLAGSEVQLADGSVVIADTDYLTRAIADPAAELVAGYTLKMPANNLSDDEIAAIVAFIETLDG